MEEDERALRDGLQGALPPFCFSVKRRLKASFRGSEFREKKRGEKKEDSFE